MTLKENIRKIFTEAYNRKDKLILQDIIKVAQSNDIHDVQFSSLNPGTFRNITSTGNDAKIAAIKILIDFYNGFSAYDDKAEEMYEKAEKVYYDVVNIVKNQGYDYLAVDNEIKFQSDLDFDQVLDFFEDALKLKSQGTMRGGSWTSIDYITDTGVSLQIGKLIAPNFNYKVTIRGLNESKKIKVKESKQMFYVVDKYGSVVDPIVADSYDDAHRVATDDHHIQLEGPRDNKLITRDEYIDKYGFPEMRDQLYAVKDGRAVGTCVEGEEDTIKSDYDELMEFEEFINRYGYDPEVDLVNDDTPDFDDPGQPDYSPSSPWNAPGMKVSDFI